MIQSLEIERYREKINISKNRNLTRVNNISLFRFLVIRLPHFITRIVKARFAHANGHRPSPRHASHPPPRSCQPPRMNECAYDIAEFMVEQIYLAVSRV